jgi:hypothetical protein
VEVGGYVVPSSAGGTGGGAADCPPPGRGRGGGPARNQFDSGKGGLYRSLDGGETVGAGERRRRHTGRPSSARAAPIQKDRNRVYRLGTGFYVSTTSARRSAPSTPACTTSITPSGSIQRISNHLILGTDGGLVISWDRGATWDWRNNIPTGQFYEASISDDARPVHRLRRSSGQRQHLHSERRSKPLGIGTPIRGRSAAATDALPHRSDDPTYALSDAIARRFVA